ncbi:hypothetical protein BO99DRAFT_257453 [Aspergillus violaceofuscus CBS 115571]|uniref:Uncharacterized protein n=1 Tax=Aspergillus violaceofuscus (strain CBS 115571) TaxID=1450538 RepID=A0A2V5HKR9_ASPV1|nr:hypothetical protein BO99DRAFT_257453 [Aspergillus violaceofuscus CBS 115571]
MSWTQVSSTRYERPFDTIETFYRAIAAAGAPLNKEHYLITCTARLQAPLPPASAVEQAWKALRQLYPQLVADAVETDRGPRFVYEAVTSTAELDAWARDTFHIDPARSAEDLYEQLTPSPRFHLYYLPATAELVFRTPHWRMDGIGLLHLQSAFVQLLADGTVPVVDGSEAARLCAGLDSVAAGLGSIENPGGLSEADAADEELQPFLGEEGGRKGMLKLPTLPVALPAGPRRLLQSFDPDTTQHLLSACKARNITVPAAAHAALALAAVRFALHRPEQHEQQPQDYVGFNAIDLRRYLPAPWNGPAAAVSLYHTGLPFRVPLPSAAGATTHPSDEFTRLSQTFTALYRRNLSLSTPRNVFRFLPAYVERVMQVLSRAPADPLEGASHPELSSMGRVNDTLTAEEVRGRVRTVRVTTWWVAVEVINRLLLTNVWTWEERMVLSVNWNEAFYAPELVEGLLGAWREELVRGLLAG